MPRTGGGPGGSGHRHHVSKRGGSLSRYPKKLRERRLTSRTVAMPTLESLRQKAGLPDVAPELRRGPRLPKVKKDERSPG